MPQPSRPQRKPHLDSRDQPLYSYPALIPPRDKGVTRAAKCDIMQHFLRGIRNNRTPEYNQGYDQNIVSGKTHRQIILKDAFIYSAANYVSDSLGMIVSVLSKRFLGVLGAGYWTILSVIQSYGMYTTLGTKNAVYREMRSIAPPIGARKVRPPSPIRPIFHQTLPKSSLFHF